MTGTLSVLMGNASLLCLRSATASFTATNVDWSPLSPDLAVCNLDTGDVWVALLAVRRPSLLVTRELWLTVLEAIPDAAAVDLTTPNLLGFSACFICAWRCCGRAMRSGGMLPGLVADEGRSWWTPAAVSEVDWRGGRNVGELTGNDQDVVKACDFGASRAGLTLGHVLRAAAAVDAFVVACVHGGFVDGGCRCTWRPPDKSLWTLSSLGMARFIGDAVDEIAVRFIAPSMSAHNQRTCRNVYE